MGENLEPSQDRGSTQLLFRLDNKEPCRARKRIGGKHEQSPSLRPNRRVATNTNSGGLVRTFLSR